MEEKISQSELVWRGGAERRAGRSLHREELNQNAKSRSSSDTNIFKFKTNPY